MVSRPRSTHNCPGGCGLQVARHLPACRPRWRRLPNPRRDAVNGSYHGRLADPGPHRRALAAAFEWYYDNQPGGGR
jgi:hypothetical protein